MRGTYVAVGVALIALLLSVYGLYGQQTLVAEHTPVTREFTILAVEYKGTAGDEEQIAKGTVVAAYGWNPSIISVSRGDKVVLKIIGVNGKDHPTSIVGVGTAASYKVSYKIFPMEIKDGKIEVHKVQILNTPVSEENNVDQFHVWRGHVTIVEFVADKSGVFKLFCTTHQPSMTGYLIVAG